MVSIIIFAAFIWACFFLFEIAVAAFYFLRYWIYKDYFLSEEKFEYMYQNNKFFRKYIDKIDGK